MAIQFIPSLAHISASLKMVMLDHNGGVVMFTDGSSGGPMKPLKALKPLKDLNH